LRARDGREPTIAELGAAVGAEPIRLSAMLAAKERMQSASGGEAAQERARDCEDNAGFEDSVLLKDTIMRLGRPLAQVLWLRFGVGFSQAEVAARLGVSQSQLSRWEQRGKDALRQALEGTV
ncbi:MAG: sigma factor-like helix-turn-helix DNA-binding protein, partial [Clostridia bacterium]